MHTDSYIYTHVGALFKVNVSHSNEKKRKYRHWPRDLTISVSFSQIKIMLLPPSGPGTSEELNLNLLRHQYFPLLSQENETQILFFARGARDSLVLSCLCLQANWTLTVKLIWQSESVGYSPVQHVQAGPLQSWGGYGLSPSHYKNTTVTELPQHHHHQYPRIFLLCTNSSCHGFFLFFFRFRWFGNDSHSLGGAVRYHDADQTAGQYQAEAHPAASSS